jgi:hypothetical protein
MCMLWWWRCLNLVAGTNIVTLFNPVPTDRLDYNQTWWMLSEHSLLTQTFLRLQSCLRISRLLPKRTAMHATFSLFTSGIAAFIPNSGYIYVT